MPSQAVVWEHFEGRGASVQCLKCGQAVSRGSSAKGPSSLSTSPLWQHLKRHHQEAYVDSKKRQRKADDSKVIFFN